MASRVTRHGQRETRDQPRYPYSQGKPLPLSAVAYALLQVWLVDLSRRNLRHRTPLPHVGPVTLARTRGGAVPWRVKVDHPNCRTPRCNAVH